MQNWNGECVHTVEPQYVPDTFVTGIASIELLGGWCARYSYYVEGQPPGLALRPDRLIVKKLVVPLACLPQMVRQSETFIAKLKDGCTTPFLTPQ